MSLTPRERQVRDVLEARKRQVEDALEHERFDVRVQRGEWPTEKVGDLYGNPIFLVDGKVPVLALMAFKHNVALHYESRRLGPPQQTAMDLIVEVELAWPGARMNFYASTVGWRKLKRSITKMQKPSVGAVAA